MPHLFYPSHDIALANGVKHFNPPFAARRLEEDLAPLEKIWNDSINSKLKTQNSKLPWGWDYDTRALLHKEYKVKLKDLPTDEDLKLLREISSRKTTIEILKRLKEAMPGKFDEIALPKYINDFEILENIENLDIFENNENKTFVLKAPWSSSGRGQIRCTKHYALSTKNYALSTIKRQGGIILEPWYENKTQDLAELFYVGKECVRFVGYSIFHNDENGTYRYGELMSNALMSASLPQICDDTRDALIPILEDIFRPFFGKSWEVGYIGIDMMLVSRSKFQVSSSSNSETWNLEPETTALHPCVEMNVRCTMGVVARLFFDQTFGADSDEIGEFYITPSLDYERLKKMDKDFTELYQSRYHRLTEFTPETTFMAYAIMS